MLIESVMVYTVVESRALIYGIQLLILSELMLFLGLFYVSINFRLVSNGIFMF